jgi:polyphenol oxidase
MFFSSKLNKFKNLQHCFFSRRNGVSKGYYESLNCGLGSGDKKENVLKNLKLVSKKIACKEKFLITLNQTHSDKVIHIKNKAAVRNKLNGDAIVCEIKNIGISILTADCVPILFYDTKKEIIGCVHAGWKGALKGIIKNTVKKFKELNSNENDLIAVVGPCINKKNYEVKKEFYNKFLNVDKNNEKFFEKNSNKKYFFDLRGFVNSEMLNLNISNIENIDMDTFSNKKYFYSYRRSTFNKEEDYGRCISVILMT